jgi:DNA-binding transcriptional regulator YdaS (Cro superfamily)
MEQNILAVIMIPPQESFGFRRIVKIAVKPQEVAQQIPACVLKTNDCYALTNSPTDH